MHGRPDVTLLGDAAHHVLLNSLLPAGKRLWNSYPHNNSIGFDNSQFTWVQHYIHFATADIRAKV